MLKRKLNKIKSYLINVKMTVYWTLAKQSIILLKISCQLVDFTSFGLNSFFSSNLQVNFSTVTCHFTESKKKLINSFHYMGYVYEHVLCNICKTDVHEPT